MEALPLMLGQAHACYLSDALQEKAEQQESFRALLLKVLPAVLEPREVYLTKEEWWTIRDVAKSAVRVGTVAVGLYLLEACARALPILEADADVHAAVAHVGEVADEPDHQERLMEWRRSHGNKDANPGKP